MLTPLPRRTRVRGVVHHHVGNIIVEGLLKATLWGGRAHHGRNGQGGRSADLGCGQWPGKENARAKAPRSVRAAHEAVHAFERPPSALLVRTRTHIGLRQRTKKQSTRACVRASTIGSLETLWEVGAEASTFNHSNRAQTHTLLADAGRVAGVDHSVHVLVRLGRLFHHQFGGRDADRDTLVREHLQHVGVLQLLA